jgi:uncharacterized membrane protein
MKAIENIKAGFKLFFNNVIAFAAASLIVAIGSMFLITMPPMFFGMYYMANRAVKGEKPKVGDVFKGFSYFVKSWVYVILVTVIAGIGAILYPFMMLIIVAVDSKLITIISSIVLFVALIWMLLVTLSQMYGIPLIIEKGVGAFAALKESIKVFRKNIASTVVMFIILMGLGFILNLVLIGVLIMPAVMAIAFTKTVVEA